MTSEWFKAPYCWHLFVFAMIRRQRSVLMLPHPMPDWHIGHHLHAASFYPRLPVIYKRLYPFPKAFSHITLFKLHMCVRHMWLFPFHKPESQPQMVKSCPQFHRARVNCSTQAEKEQGPLSESGSPGTLLLPISIGSTSSYCHLAAKDASVSRISFTHHTCSTRFSRGYKWMSSYFCEGTTFMWQKP